MEIKRRNHNGESSFGSNPANAAWIARGQTIVVDVGNRYRYWRCYGDGRFDDVGLYATYDQVREKPHWTDSMANFHTDVLFGG